MMINGKAAFSAFLVLANTITAHAALRGSTNLVDPTNELHMIMEKTRILKDAGGATKTSKDNKSNRTPPTENPAGPETIVPTALPTGPPTALRSEMSSMTPTSQPTLLPTSKPAAPPSGFDSSISVVCKPDGTTTLTPEEANAKTIICNAAKPSCREAITAVKESAALQNFFACAGNLGEGAARKLFNKYAADDMLAEQLTLVADVGMTLVTERPDAMKAACMVIATTQSPSVDTACCQGASGCTSTTVSASPSPPFMTIAVTACTGGSACKDMGPNPLILDSSCTGASACESMNENEINPSITGVTFVGEMACTTPQSCEGVGHRSHGDVTIQQGACIGSNSCNAAGRRVKQSGASFRFRSHIDIGSNACVGSNSCKDAHSTVDHGTAGKYAGSLSIGAGGCTANGSCEKMGFNDRMRTDIIVPPGGCGSVDSCRGCTTKTECSADEVYIISDVDGACPKGGSDSNHNPTGDKVDKFCVGKGTLPTDCPTLFPTPFPTPLTAAPTSNPTILASDTPSSSPSDGPSHLPSQSPSDLPSSLPSEIPSGIPSSSPSQTPSDTPSQHPSDIPSRAPILSPSERPSQTPSTPPSGAPSAVPSSWPSDMPSMVPSASSLPSDMPSALPSSLPSDLPSSTPTETPQPTGPPATFNVGCLETPGNGLSTFNDVVGDVSCDGATGICADFVSMVDDLDNEKERMIKSVFGCNDEATPQPVTLAVAQARFDKMKNDASVTAALLAAVDGTKKLFTGAPDVVTTQCDTDCCTGTNGCSTDTSSGVMTVSDGSCLGNSACKLLTPDSIILESCTENNACNGLGSVQTPPVDFTIGFRVIGPGACTAANSCRGSGGYIYGNIRFETGACNADSACRSIAIRMLQLAAPQVTANVFIGENACQGNTACENVHAQVLGKTSGSLTIEKDAYKGDSACSKIAENDFAVNDLIVREGICDATGMSCADCLPGRMCGNDFTLTYVIDNAGDDCPGPNTFACEGL